MTYIQIPFMPIAYGPPPDRLVPPGKKDKKYRTDMARSLVGGVSPVLINGFRQQYWINSKFVSGDQWVMQEDIDTFLNDSDGNVRNRIKANINIVRQVVEKNRGTASQMTFNASLRSVSPLSKTRKDEAYEQVLFMQHLAQQSPIFKQIIKGHFPIGENEEETAGIFQSFWIDSITEAVNELMNFIAQHNKLDRFTRIEAQDLALSGMCAYAAKGSRKHLEFERIQPDRMLWDTQATQPDLSDGSWIGYQGLSDPMSLFEHYDLSRDEMDAIEKSARTGFGNYALQQQYRLHEPNNGLWGLQQIPTLNVYWRDGMWREYGYVRDETGEPSWQCINYIPADSPPDYKPKYTDSDLVEPPDTPSAWKALHGQKKRTCWSEMIRYSEFVPWEYLVGGSPADRKQGDVRDIELAGGVYDLQEYNPHDTSKVSFPVKAVTWAIEDGRVIAPVSDVISPQRLFNRCLSVIESRMNKSGGSGVIIDTSMLDQSMSAKQAAIAIKNGDTLFFDSHMKGVPQAVGGYDSGITSSTQALFGVMGELMSMARFVSATPEGVTGNASSDTLVRVNNSNIQGANLLDEPFYAALQDLKEQLYQFSAMAGKNWYAERPEVLAEIVGNGNDQAILMAKDIMLESVRCFVVRDSPEAVRRQQADGMITFFAQMGLLGQAQIATLYNVASPDQVTRAAKQYVIDSQIAAKEAQKAQQAQAQMAGFALREAELRAQENQVYQNQTTAAQQDANNAAKGQAIVTRAAADAVYAPPEQVTSQPA